ncbi:ABC transporter permease subunit [Rubripirellula reticaptiva]|uniref:ABC-2 family transporter protein n=1 Tax=Rubripirellula reticaptiva TaxID=2528013 RepID=A0A5C6EHV9_9BACT|nr:ABC transporter permease subunit [Rubripirellula reticaptiva]TWU48064.1 ABC-2 family transporter protein [Rubripirellula reticaptiva]
MINRILVRKYIGQSLLLFAACGLALFAFAWVRVWVVCLLDMGQFTTILEQFRDFEKYAPIEFDALFTYPGRVGMTYDEPIVILCTVIWCISRGSDVISGELGRGTLEMLLAQPIRRRTLLLSHATVSVVGLAMLCLLVWAGIAVGVMATTVTESVSPPSFRIPIFNLDIPLTVDKPVTQTMPLSDRVDVEAYAASTFHLFAFGFFLLGLSTMFSALDRYRWRTVGAVVGIYVIQLVMFGLGKAAESLSWLLSLSFFSCYKPQKMTSLVSKHGSSGPWSLTETVPDGALPPLVYPLILIGLGMLFYAFAIHHFGRRDLPAPL